LSFTLRIEPLGATVPILEGESVLEAAQRSGVTLARSCRNGSCRACLCHLQGGELAYRVEWPSLSPDDKDEGAMLPCVALARSDLLIHAPKARYTAPA
jgi:ferredoxin